MDQCCAGRSASPDFLHTTDKKCQFISTKHVNTGH